MYLILAIVSGLLTAVSFPTVFGSVYLPNLGFLGWISLAPLFYAIRSSSPWHAFRLSFLTAAVYYGISLYWLYTAFNTYGHLNPFVSVCILVLLIVILSVYISLAPLLASWIEVRTKISRLWTLPILWVALEFARNYGPCGGFPWCNITNSQYAYLPVIQIADLVGVYGLTYVMAAVNCAVVSLSLCLQPGQRTAPHLDRIILASVLIVATVVYGYWRLYNIDREQGEWASIKTAMVQGNVPQEDKYRVGLEEDQLQMYQEKMQTLKDSNIDLIVWPESAYPWPVSVAKETIPGEHLGGLTGDELILFGALTINQEGKRTRLWNSALLTDAGGGIIGRYHKMHLVPFGEYVPYKKVFFFVRKLVAPVGDFVAGEKGQGPLSTATYKVAPLVCYEDVFPEIARRLVKRGGNLIAVITNDAWYGRSSAAFQHLAISVFRSVETRRWMVRAANTGVSAVVDAAGRVIAGAGLFEGGIIVAGVRLTNKESPYLKYGDWFAWVCVGVGVVLIVLSLRPIYHDNKGT